MEVDSFEKLKKVRIHVFFFKYISYIYIYIVTIYIMYINKYIKSFLNPHQPGLYSSSFLNCEKNLPGF